MSGRGPKRCYYEVLEVDPSAEEDDIKRAYRKVRRRSPLCAVC